jgi:DNA invertase Pin-like site-specific DNA recombinase
MTRVALYARFSDDKQNPRSADDQLEALRIIVRARGLEEVAAFADEAISGASLSNRSGVQQLLALATGGGCDLVLAEALDRLSRDQEGTAHIFKRLSFHGVALETLSEGRISELHVGLSATMNQMFLVELGKKTRRGLVAQVKAGRSGGGHCYGYAIPARGELAIDPDQAAVVRRIFADYDRGLSPRAIAAALNAEGVAGPRGGAWSASTLNGDRRARDGLLHQSLYAGERIFNRRKFRKHPDTGRRSSVLNPEAEWIRMPAPELRLIDEALWARVQARNAALSATPGPYARRPRRLLSGLIRCGACGAAMTLQDRLRYVCSGRRERGTCDNAVYAHARDVEARVLDGLRAQLLSPAAVQAAVRQHHADDMADRQAALGGRARAEAELAEVARRHKRLVMQVEEGMPYASVRERMEELQVRRTACEAALAATQAPPVQVLHPSAASHYAALAGQLADCLDGDDAQEVREILRGLIDRVVLTPLPGHGRGRGAYALAVHGELQRLLAGPQTQNTPRAGARGAIGSHGRVLKVGAGTGFGQQHNRPGWVFAA